MCDVFLTSYKGSYPIKTYLLNQLGYSEKKFKKEFNLSQQSRLESCTAADVVTFDISLLFALLQRTCGLAKRDDPQWTKAAPNPSSLEHLIYCLKELRNNLAHEKRQFTEYDLITSLTHLQNLITDIYHEAVSRLKLPPSSFDTRLGEVYENFKALKSEKVVLKELVQQIQVLMQELVIQIKHEGRVELCTIYKDLCMIEPAAWLCLQVRYKPSLAFITLLLQENKEVSGRPSQKHHIHKVEVDNILKETLDDGSLPNIIILSGEGGIGKTTLVYYLIEKYYDPQAPNHLSDVDIVLYSQCRGSTMSSFDQLLENLLHNTFVNCNINFKDFKDLILGLQVLIIIDGFDESREEAKKMVTSILSLAQSNVQVLLTTRPTGEEQLTALIPQGKRALHLLITGIPQDKQTVFINKMLDNYGLPEDQKDKVKTNLHNKIVQLRAELGEQLNNPLILTLLTVLCVECPDKVNTPTTTITTLFFQIRKYMESYLKRRLLPRDCVQEKISSFMECYDDTAYETLRRKEFEMSEETVKILKQKCVKLELPHQDVLSTFLVMRRTRCDLSITNTWSYQHLRQQEFAASMSVVRKLKNLDEESHTTIHTPSPQPASAVVGHINITKQMKSDISPKGRSTVPQMVTKLGHTLISLTKQLTSGRDHQPQSNASNGDARNNTGRDFNPYSDNTTECSGAELKDNMISQILSMGSQASGVVWSWEDSTYQAVLLHITGILAVSHQHLLHKHAHEIIQLIGSAHFINVDVYLQHVAESESNREVTKEVVQVLSVHTAWWSNGLHWSVLPPILREVHGPQEIIMDMYTDPVFSPGMVEALRALSCKDLYLKLRFYHHYFGESVGGEDDAHLIAIMSGQNCTLMEIKGCLSQSCIALLPTTLCKLCIRCLTHDLPTLAATLPNLRNLCHLGNYVLSLSLSQ